MRELARRGIEFSIGVKQSTTIRLLIDEIPEADWVTIPDYPDTGQAQIAESPPRRLPGSSCAAPACLRHAGRALARLAPSLLRDQPHHPAPRRRYRSPRTTPRSSSRSATSKTKPSLTSRPDRCTPNSAWTVIAAIAHNLGRWTTLIGLPQSPRCRPARARRRHRPPTPARLTRTSRQWTLRLPARWPWQTRLHHHPERDPRAPRSEPDRAPASRPSTSEPHRPPAALTPARKRPPEHQRENADTRSTA